MYSIFRLQIKWLCCVISSELYRSILSSALYGLDHESREGTSLEESKDFCFSTFRSALIYCLCQTSATILESL